MRTTGPNPGPRGPIMIRNLGLRRRAPAPPPLSLSGQQNSLAQQNSYLLANVRNGARFLDPSVGPSIGAPPAPGTRLRNYSEIQTSSMTRIAALAASARESMMPRNAFPLMPLSESVLTGPLSPPPQRLRQRQIRRNLFLDPWEITEGQGQHLILDSNSEGDVELDVEENYRYFGQMPTRLHNDLSVTSTHFSGPVNFGDPIPSEEETDSIAVMEASISTDEEDNNPFKRVFITISDEVKPKNNGKKKGNQQAWNSSNVIDMNKLFNHIDHVSEDEDMMMVSSSTSDEDEFEPETEFGQKKKKKIKTVTQILAEMGLTDRERQKVPSELMKIVRDIEKSENIDGSIKLKIQDIVIKAVQKYIAI